MMAEHGSLGDPPAELAREERTFGEKLADTTARGEAMAKGQPDPGENVVSMEGHKAAQTAKKGKATPVKAKPKKAARKPKKAPETPPGSNAAHINGDMDNLTIGFITEIQVMDRELESLRGRRRNRFKQAKSDGIDTAAAAKVLRELKNPADEIIGEMNAMNSLRRVFDLPAGTIMKLESSRTGETEINHIAELEGKRNAYRGGHPSNNPHDAELPAGQAWLRGFNDATAKIQAATKPTVFTKFAKPV